MASTNNAAILFGDLLQLSNGVIGAGASQVETLTGSAAPSSGLITLKFWGLETATIPCTTEPTGAQMTTALNAIFGTAYAAPFTVSDPVVHVYTITASPTGPFAFLPLPLVTIGQNTTAITYTTAISTPGLTKETFATVNGVEVMPWPGATKDVETYMTLDAGTNGYKRKVAKFADAGNVAFTVNMTNDAQQNAVTGFRFMFGQQQAFNWRIVEPTKTVGAGIIIPGSTFYYSAYVSKFQRDGNTPDARQRWTGSLEIDGSVLELPPIA